MFELEMDGALTKLFILIICNEVYKTLVSTTFNWGAIIKMYSSLSFFSVNYFKTLSETQ